MKMPKDDVLNAIVTDLVADQVVRALELGFKRKEVEDAVRIGVSHGTYEHAEREKEMDKTSRMIARMGAKRRP